MLEFQKRFLIAIAIVAAFAGTAPALAQISLGTAESFGVLAGSTLTNTGATLITGNVGVSPGSSVTGFPPGVVVPPGAIHAGDAFAAQAQLDLTASYNAISAIPTLVDLTGTDLGGLTLTPNVYGFSSVAQLTGTLTLDAQGNPDAIFIFKIGSALTTASGSSVLVVNGGSNCKVYWQIGTSATLGSGTAFAGNILALASITFTTGSSISGRALARNGAVTLDGNGVAICAPAGPVCPIITLSPTSLPPGNLGTPYNQVIVASGSTALPYTYSVSLGSLPDGLTLDSGTGAITGTPTTIGTFVFIITATDTDGCSGSQPYTLLIGGPGCPPILLSPATLPSGSQGVPYNEVVVASGGQAPYTYSLTGTLPTGLVLDTSTGAITGTPLDPGIFNFVITATDANSCPGAMAYTIVILDGTVTAIPTLSETGALIFAILLAGASLLLLRRAG